jgi:hypothetical protein
MTWPTAPFKPESSRQAKTQFPAGYASICPTVAMFRGTTVTTTAAFQRQRGSLWHHPRSRLCGTKQKSAGEASGIRTKR